MDQSSPEYFQVFFGSEECYKWMRISPLSAMVWRLLLDRIETSICCLPESEETTNAILHAHDAAFP